MEEKNNFYFVKTVNLFFTDFLKSKADLFSF